MIFKNFKYLRFFIFLLTTVFLLDTVYASGMMTAAQISANNSDVTEDHLEVNHYGDAQHSDAHSNHHHDSHKKQSSDSGCSKSSHCMACFTVLPPSQLKNIQSQMQQITTSLFKTSYISHVSARLQRPPIS